jgi:hypothetical protein
VKSEYLPLVYGGRAMRDDAAEFSESGLRAARRRVTFGVSDIIARDVRIVTFIRIALLPLRLVFDIVVLLYIPPRLSFQAMLRHSKRLRHRRKAQMLMGRSPRLLLILSTKLMNIFSCLYK